MTELFLLIILVVDFAFVLWMFRHGSDWLLTSIVLNLLLVSVFGGKLISVFGLTTNTGNIFYAAVFFATYLLVEHDGLKYGLRALWLGVAATTFFMAMTQLEVHMPGLAATSGTNEAMRQLFTFAPRVALASLTAFVAAQSLNILLYDWLRGRWKDKRLWMRAAAAICSAQLLDSVIFFSIAFLGIIPLGVMAEIIAVGYLIKISAGVAGIPLLYYSYKINADR